MKEIALAIFAVGMAYIANEYHDIWAAIFAVIASIALLNS